MIVIRLLFISDSQLKMKNPSKRLDQYPTTMLRKFVELSNVIVAAHIDYVVHGGDMFDLPRVSPDYVGKIAELIRFTDVPWYVVPGNHDIYGYTIKTIDQTMLGLLARTNVLNLLTRQTPTILTDMKDGFSISLQGQEFYAEIDKGNAADYDIVPDSSCQYHILAAHGMLLDKPFHQQVNHTLVSDLNSQADVILAGHYHPGYDPIRQGKTLVLNPGSMARVEAGIGDDRIPQYTILELTRTDIKFKMFEFRTARPAVEILDFAGKKNTATSLASLNTFKATLQSNAITTNTIDVPTALGLVAADPANNISITLIADAINAMARTQQSADDAIPKLDGFVESADRVWIEEVEGENFQSHRKLHMEFANGLNVIRGESNSGKTSIMRLIRWVQSNEPKGADVISNWATSCWGSIKYSNGYKIKRSRTKTASGEYELTDPSGAVTVFKGFGSDVPPEILNAHQMPPVFITKDAKRNIAMATQLEQSFLVTESAGFRAAAIGRLTGVQHVDATMRALSAENKNLSKDSTVKDKIIKTENLKLDQFVTLPGEQSMISMFSLLIDSAQETEDLLDYLTTTKRNIDSIDNDMQTTEFTLDKYIGMPVEDDIILAESEYQLICELTRSKENILRLDNSIRLVQKEQESIKELIDAGPMINEAEIALQEAAELYTIKNKILAIENEMVNTQKSLAKVDSFLKYKDLLQDGEAVLAELNSIVVLKTKIDEIDNSLMNVGYQMDEIDMRIEGIEAGLGKMFDEGLCECETCGQVVTKEILLGKRH